MKSISYAVTTHNEGLSIDNLLNRLMHHARSIDEIVILDDFSDDTETLKILRKHKKVYKHKFNKNFSDQKNFLNSLCNGDYIFQLDGDELPSTTLCTITQSMINHRDDIDLYWIPRDNRLYDLDMKYIDKWNWKVDEKKRINYPDYQGRLYKNSPNIKWIRPVHEIISGHKTQVILPRDSNVDIYHHRHMNHQLRSNKFYDANY